MLRPLLKVFNPRTLCAIAAATFVFHNVNAQVLLKPTRWHLWMFTTPMEVPPGPTAPTGLITPVASWYGVTTADGRVTHLKLAANGLTGALPAGLAALDSLHVLDVSGNAL
jgi:hypothetical protein